MGGKVAGFNSPNGLNGTLSGGSADRSRGLVRKSRHSHDAHLGVIRWRTYIGLTNSRCRRLRLHFLRYAIGAERIMPNWHERRFAKVRLMIDR